MAVDLPYPTLTTSPATKAEVEGNFSVLAAKFGAIGNADVGTSDPIGLNKLAASYEWTRVTLVFNTTLTAVAYYTPFIDDGKGAWTCTKIEYASNDVGSTSPTFSVDFGTLVTGVYTAATTLAASAVYGGSTDNANAGTVASPSSAITPGSTTVFRVNCTGAGTSTGAMNIVATLKRQITAA